MATVSPSAAHPFRRAPGEVAWRCACGMSRNAAVHRNAATPTPPARVAAVTPDPPAPPARVATVTPAPPARVAAVTPDPPARPARVAAVTVPTSHLPAGEPVLTTEVLGTDFGLPLVRPAKARGGGRVRVVRSHCRAHGGVVVWFTDGTKTPPLHGRTVWVVAEPDADAHEPARVPA